MRRAQTKKKKLDSDTVIERHAKSLGFASLDNYFQWCGEHDFPVQANKHRKQLAREALRCKEIREEELAAKLRRPPRELHKQRPLERIIAICDRTVELSELHAAQEQHLWQLLHLESEPKIEPINREALKELVRHVYSVKANFFAPVEAIHLFGRSSSNTFLHGLAMIAAHGDAWRRPLTTWKPRSYNPRRQFATLLRHLFDQYNEVPPFFDSAWFTNREVSMAMRRQWFLHLGAGHSLRHCQLPIEFNRKMTSWIRHAPANLSVDQALRWAQVRGLSGSERLAAAVLGTRLGQQFEHEEFWRTVLHWLAEQSLLDSAQVGPIVDYLHHQRFEDMDISLVERRPLQPNLSMKGRSVPTLLRQIEQWHRSLGRIVRASDKTWTSICIPPLRWAEGQVERDNLKIWTIRELLSARELQVEGRKLKHCVASYTQTCVNGENSIWTLELQQNGSTEKLLTLQVRSQGRVLCQARGKMNRYPTEKESGVIRRWAEQARLTITCPLL